MAELKPGGMALVIRGEDCGKCVTTERFIPGKSEFIAPDGKNCTAARGCGGWLCTGDVNPKDRPEIRGWALFRTENLLPIDGDEFQHEDDQQKELTHG